MKDEETKLKTVAPHPFAGKAWIKRGLIYAVFMFIVMTLVLPMVIGEFSTGEILAGIPIWLVAGLTYGYVMKIVLDKRAKSMEENS